MIKKIISGGQTGVDQAGLDAAIDLNIAYDGFIPKGRKSEDGIVDEKYNLKELKTASYPARTRKNVSISDGILVIKHEGKTTPGTTLTHKTAVELKKPVYLYLISEIKDEVDSEKFNNWILDHRIKNLMIAGPRESHKPIYDRAREILTTLLQPYATKRKV